MRGGGGVGGANRRAGQTGPSLLQSCYRRSLEVADELGARTMAFPLVSAGIYGWPMDDAIDVAVETLSTTPSRVEQVRLVALDAAVVERIETRLGR